MQTRLHTDHSRLIVTTCHVAVLRFFMFGYSLLRTAIFATFYIPHPTLYSYSTGSIVRIVSSYRYKETVFCYLTQRIRSATAFSEKHLQTDDKYETIEKIEIKN